MEILDEILICINEVILSLPCGDQLKKIKNIFRLNIVTESNKE